MPFGPLLSTQFFQGPSEYLDSNLPSHPESNDLTSSPLCRNCAHFLQGLPQTWTQEDFENFREVSSCEHERGVVIEEPERAQQILRRCHIYFLKDMLLQSHYRTCHLCGLIRAAFVGNGDLKKEFLELEKRCIAGEGVDFKIRITPRAHSNIGRFPYWLAVDLAMTDKNIQLWTNLFLVPSTEADLNDTGKAIETSTSSDTSFELARSWLSTCLGNHSECKPSAARHGELPARLLDIRDLDSGIVFLHITSKVSGHYHYLALSHCWGKSHRLVLLEENLEELLSGISVQRLTLTFQHAVQVTRKLGYRYLWIDCLCIIQNSEKDWSVEASKMASTYGNSVCCIAAVASSDSEGGCFRDREPFEKQPLRLERNIFPNISVFEPGPILIAKDDILRPHFTLHGSARPLDTRGWTLQEQVLAPRTLLYTRSEISWECRKVTASELWPSGIPNDIWNTALAGYSKSAFDTRKLLPAERRTHYAAGDERILYRRWEALVQEYNERSLTKSEDKFPALAGIAEEMMSVTNDTYFAGIWRSDFCRGLTWMIRSFSLKTRPIEYRAPSWSWASVDGLVQYDEAGVFEKDMECDVEDIQVENIYNIITGRVKTGHVVLHGMIRRTEWVLGPTVKETSRHLVDKVSSGWLDDMIEVHADTLFNDVPNPIYLFQLYRSTSTNPFRKDRIQCLHGLILEAVNLSERTFRRLGYMRSKREREISAEEWRYFVEDWSRERVILF